VLAGAADLAHGEDRTSASTVPCALGSESGSLTRQGREERGAGSFTTIETFIIRDERRRTLLRVEDSVHESANEHRFDVRCVEGAVILEIAEPAAASVLLAFDQRRRTFTLSPEVTASLKAGWSARPGQSGALAHWTAERGLLEKVERIAGVDAMASANLLVIREQLAAGRWAEADEWLSSGPFAERLPALWRGRLRALQDELARLRGGSQPVRLVEPRHIGQMMVSPVTPLDFGVLAPTLFWRSVENDLCAIQGAPAAGQMRCYQPDRRNWGAPIPATAPALQGDHAVRRRRPPERSCPGPEFLDFVPNDGADPCGGSPVEMVLALVEGPRLLVETWNGAREAATYAQNVKGEERPLTPSELNALVAASAGTRIVGQGCCVLGPDPSLLHRAGEPARTWRALPPDFPPQRWFGTPVASPDQRWVVLTAREDGSKAVGLWIFHVIPGSPP